MSLLDKIVEIYGKNEPFTLEEVIEKENITEDKKEKFKDEFLDLVKTEQIIMFEWVRILGVNIFYVPKKTKYGNSILSPYKVVNKYFIGCNDNIIGYLGDYSLLNQLKLTTQVPNVITVISNVARWPIDEITLGSQKVRVYKSYVEITNENVNVCVFLSALDAYDTLDDEAKRVLIDYIEENNIKESDVIDCISCYPERVSKKLIMSGLTKYLKAENI